MMLEEKKFFSLGIVNQWNNLAKCVDHDKRVITFEKEIG